MTQVEIINAQITKAQNQKRDIVKKMKGTNDQEYNALRRYFIAISERIDILENQLKGEK